MDKFVKGLNAVAYIANNILIWFLGLYVKHPTCMIWVTLSIIGLWFMNHRPNFTRYYLICSPRLNFGTFLGSFIHLNIGHFFANLVLFVPASIYVDNIGYGVWFGLAISYANAVLMGLLNIVRQKETCGVSGIAYMLAIFDLFYHISSPDVPDGIFLIRIALIVMVMMTELVTLKDKNLDHFTHWFSIIMGLAIAIFLNCR